MFAFSLTNYFNSGKPQSSRRNTNDLQKPNQSIPWLIFTDAKIDDMSEKLTYRQELFVSNYLQDPNATKAAIKAGYSPKTAYSQGQRLLKNVEVRKRVKLSLEKATMDADEVLQRLSEQARASVFDVLNDDGDLDIADIRERGVADLVKKLKVTKKPSGETSYEFEIHDAQAALVHLAKYHKLFDRNETNVNVQMISGIDLAILFLREAMNMCAPEEAKRLLLEWNEPGVTDTAKHIAVETVLLSSC